MQSDGGDIVPPDGYLEAVQALCRKHGILFIVDEVKIGFGRTGKMWGYQHSGLEPDVVVLGKSMGSGFAGISGVVAPAVAHVTWSVLMLRYLPPLFRDPDAAPDPA